MFQIVRQKLHICYRHNGNLKVKTTNQSNMKGWGISYVFKTNETNSEFTKEPCKHRFSIVQIILVIYMSWIYPEAVVPHIRRLLTRLKWMYAFMTIPYRVSTLAKIKRQQPYEVNRKSPSFYVIVREYFNVQWMVRIRSIWPILKNELQRPH